MGKKFFRERKVKSNDIVNGVARTDIYDNQGVLLVKRGSRVGESHYKRMNKEGFIQKGAQKTQDSLVKSTLHYSGPETFHARLSKQISLFSSLQTKMVSQPEPKQADKLIQIADALQSLCKENINQVIGELFLSSPASYHFSRPLYQASLLIELINRFNLYQPTNTISPEKQDELVLASLTYNLGLLHMRLNASKEDEDDVIETPEPYTPKSLEILQSIGLTSPGILDLVANHTRTKQNPSFDSSLFQTPYVFSLLAMPKDNPGDATQINNPSKEFTALFASGRLDPVLGSLFLKINGMVPVGAILLFESRERALVIKGPEDTNISSSQIRMLVDKMGIQLKKPGAKVLLHESTQKLSGLYNHNLFAWFNFPSFAMWEQ